ncbi:Alpha/Beta hydrolase protein [Lipomyces kononenkoae]|uniref:Alpha/Beta hydrolase protein n=1 Tax=Lipomyces kononenkoae TaxID=34357 RepID=A0ACC3SQL1_LIPKO
MKATCLVLLFAAGTFALTLPTFPKPVTQSTAWNSSFKFSQEQIELGQLWPDLADNLETILNFDRSQLANGGPSQDSFYKLDNGTSLAPPHCPGQVLKVQNITNPAAWNIPAKTALSRFIYTTTNANGTLIPASAYVLWPWTAKQFGAKSNGKAPVVLWSHGTSGFFADGSPSAHRALFYGNIMPFTLAQAGYAVIATDYAGLGVQTSWDGSYVPHQYINRLANAFDSLYALRAARSIFSDKITDEYVNVGHSQGGTAAWGVSEVLAENSDKKFQDLECNYLGTIIFAPGMDTLDSAPQVFGPWIGKDLHLMYPDFKLSDWLLPLGVDRTELLTQIQGGQYVSELLLLANVTKILNPAWNESWYATAFTEFTNPGNRPYKAPMIMFQGTEDQGTEPYMRALSTFESTCENYHSGAFEFVALTGVAHFPSMDSSRQQWLQWIEDRFNKKPVGSNQCTKSTLNSFLPAESYQELSTSFPQWAGAANEFFELVAGGF